MAISTEEAMSSYGYVFDIAKAVPELNDLLNQGIKNEWTAAKLTAMVESSGWWKNNADVVRNLAITRAAEPGTYNNNLAKAKNLVTLKAQSLGRQIDDKTASNLALQSLISNSSWDDQVLTQMVTNGTKLFINHDIAGQAAYVGTAAQLNAHMEQLATNYGVPVTKDWMRGMLTQIQAGRDSIDGFESMMKARAKAAYPQFASQFDAGMTLADIADPYISTMAQTLEIPETSVKLSDPHIKKALAQTASDGVTQTSMPLWQFERKLKDDPRWDKTKQAKQGAFDLISQIGKDFGFMGGS